jgi:hypothetical protein
MPVLQIYYYSFFNLYIKDEEEPELAPQVNLMYKLLVKYGADTKAIMKEGEFEQKEVLSYNHNPQSHHNDNHISTITSISNHQSTYNIYTTIQHHLVPTI